MGIYLLNRNTSESLVERERLWEHEPQLFRVLPNRDTVLNQSAPIFNLGYFLNSVTHRMPHFQKQSSRSQRTTFHFLCIIDIDCFFAQCCASKEFVSPETTSLLCSIFFIFKAHEVCRMYTFSQSFEFDFVNTTGR